MKWKIFRIVLVSCLLITALFSGGAVFAQDEELPDPGITPDSPFYFLDKWGKGLGMFFSFGDEAKVKKALKYGEERLAEAEAMAEKNRIREMERAANDYEGYMAMVNERLENHGISDNVTERVCLATSNHFAVLERIRERAHENAGEAIANAENASINGQINALRALAQNRFERALELTSEAAERQTERARLRICDNVTSENGTEGMELLLGFIDRIEELEDELIAEGEELGTDITPLLENLAHSSANRLVALSEAWDNASENGRQGIENAMENSLRKYESVTERLRAGNTSANVSNEETVTNRIQEEVRSRLQIHTYNGEDSSNNGTGGNQEQLQAGADDTGDGQGQGNNEHNGN